MIRSSLFALLCVVNIGAADPNPDQSTPEKVFAAFKKALAAKDKEAVQALVADKLSSSELKNLSGLREFFHLVIIAESKTEGDIGIALIKADVPGNTAYDDIGFIRQDGKWRLCLKGSTMPSEKYSTLRKWYRARKKELGAE
jgi:hypothetical protein